MRHYNIEWSVSHIHADLNKIAKIQGHGQEQRSDTSSKIKNERKDGYKNMKHKSRKEKMCTGKWTKSTSSYKLTLTETFL